MEKLIFKIQKFEIETKNWYKKQKKTVVFERIENFSLKFEWDEEKKNIFLHKIMENLLPLIDFEKPNGEKILFLTND